MSRNDANIDRYVVVLYPKVQSRTCPDWLLNGKNHSTNWHLECLNCVCVHSTVYTYYLATMLHLVLVSVFHQDCVHLKCPSTPRSQCLEMPDIIPNRRAAYFWLMWPKAKEKRDKNTRVFHLNSTEYNHVKFIFKKTNLCTWANIRRKRWYDGTLSDCFCWVCSGCCGWLRSVVNVIVERIHTPKSRTPKKTSFKTNTNVDHTNG